MTRPAIALGCVFSVLINVRAHADDLTVLPPDAGGGPTAEMLTRYLKRKAHEALGRRLAAYEELKTPEQFAACERRMRQFFIEKLGGFPERTPLNPRVVGTVNRDGYRVEKLIYESQPRHFVTASLYVPEVEPPFPAVLVPCGHSRDGKVSSQRPCILLAKHGIAALCYDPIGQGERYQLLDADGKPRFKSTTEHTLVGASCILLGRNTATYRVWDGIRSIDYLADRDDIDASRIGVTGCSGGGTLTSYLMALDDRVACAAPSCYLTSFRRLIETIGPQDAEQNIHGQLAFGMDHADYLMMHAPRPTLILASTRDFFDIDGTWDTFRQAKRFYTRLGFPERVSLVETDAKHGYPRLQREAMLRWMRRWLQGIDEPATEPEIAPLSAGELLCTPRGQVMLVDGARSVVDLNVELNEQFEARRREIWKDPEHALAEVRRLAGIRALADLPEPKVKRVGTVEREGYRIEKTVLEPESGILLPALLFRPQAPSGRRVLYLNGAGKSVDAQPDGPIEERVRSGDLVLAVDLRGTGEAGSRSDNLWGGHWNDFFLAYLLGESLVGMRAEDVLITARFLSRLENGGRSSPVDLVAVGVAAPPALHAAALESQLFGDVRLTRPLRSWSDVVRGPAAGGQLANTVHGALRVYDLPDLLRSLPPPADPPGMVDRRGSRLKRGGFWDGFWDGFWTRDPSKLSEDGDRNGVNAERNATARALAAIAGEREPDAFLDRGGIRFKVKINREGLEPTGGGKHLVNLASFPSGLRFHRRGALTRVEIANPGGWSGDPRPRLVLHNYVFRDGERTGGARSLGRLPWTFEPDRWVEVDWSWELAGRTLTVTVNGKSFEDTLIEGSEGPGRYWGPGHIETRSGRGRFWFGDVKVSPPANRDDDPGRAGGREGGGGAKTSEGEPARVLLVENGMARLPILVRSAREPAAELERYLERISGADFELAQAAPGKAGVYVGTASEFPWLALGDTSELGQEGFLLRSDGKSLYLIAQEPLGSQHAVTTFLYRLGCRWFFPGAVWAVVPEHKTIAGSWNEHQTPSFTTQRRIWYGYGAYRQGKAELTEWERHNCMGGPLAVSIGHTWHGLEPEADFAEHPEWFALVDGRRQASKPCYSHPQVVERAIEFALDQAARGSTMISMSPPDGLDYCECERCLAVFRGRQPFRAHKTLFARRTDGRTVNVTSETLFAFVNRVAAAVAQKYPETLIGCYAYSAYSHPPSFKLHPNVYLQTTTAYRRTPITLEEQISAFGEKTKQVGIREYYSVYQWDWDYPSPGKVTPTRLAEDLKFYHRHGITAVNAETSNNWAARGLGYYAASQLMWDVDVDVKEVVRDFYQKAFGPAAVAMQRYYVRWYGPDVAVLQDERDIPKPRVLYEKGKFDVDALKAAYRDLDEAVSLVPADSAYRKRVDLLRMYAHYLFLRYRLHKAEQADDRRQIVDAIKAETIFGGRLTNTNMIHSRPLIGKAFLRRFQKYQVLLTNVDEAQQAGKGWRQMGDPPTRNQLETLWSTDKAELGILEWSRK